MVLLILLRCNEGLLNRYGKTMVMMHLREFETQLPGVP